jgi:hypothetical protein
MATVFSEATTTNNGIGGSINPKKVIFFTVFLVAFVFSGLITITHIIPFRMGLISLIIIPLIFIYGIKLDRVAVAYIILSLLVILSALLTKASLLELVAFLRIPIFSFLIYYLVNIFITSENISRIIKLCIYISVVQLPLVIFQQLFYSRFPTRFTQGINPIDFDFGTFNANDAPLSIFCVLIVIFLLFDNKHNYIVRYKWPIALWLTLTVLIVNAEILKFVIILVWGIYFLRYLSIRVFVSIIVIFSLALTILSFAGVLNQIWSDFSYSLRSNTSTGQLQEEAFLSGAYSRGAAISYYLNQDIKWLGDGPSKYFNVFNNIRMRGNTGHLFTFYAEVGLLGWMASVFILFLIAVPGYDAKIRISLVGILSFVAMMLLSLTTQIMNDVSIFLIFCIIQKCYLIPQQAKPEIIS